MLGALDPYGDAIFNSRQIPALLRELDSLPPNVGEPGLARSALSAVLCCEPLYRVIPR
jgi:hypothetical protein